MNAKPSLFSSLYLGRNEIKITSKQRTILKNHAAGIISCGL